MAAVNGQDGKPLTFKQEQFCRGIVEGKTQIEAYREAYNSTSTNQVAIEVTACQLASDPRIALRILELRVPAQEKFQKYREKWLYEAMACAFIDPGDFFDREGNPIDVPALPEACRKMLTAFEIAEEFTGKGESRQSVGYTRKFKMLSKLDAMKTFGEALGWFPGQGDKVKGFKTELKDGKGRSITVEYVTAQQGP